jgi:uncharacterized protein (DUF427 family)
MNNFLQTILIFIKSDSIMRIKKIKPRPGQESVWDYPRPPRLERFNGDIHIVYKQQTIVETSEAYRIIETSHPPTYYLPISHFVQNVLEPTSGSSMCEYKGRAQYYDVVVGDKTAVKSAWQYPEAKGQFAPIRDCVAVYAHLMDACYVNKEKVSAQEGSFYGGWITSNIVGPFKGTPGTWGW